MLKFASAVVLLLSCCFSSHPLSAQEHAAGAGHPEAGEHLFKQNCASCHSVVPEQKLVGPSLHAEMKGHPPKKTPDQVRQMILNGNGAMPPFRSQLADQDIEDLIAYLRVH